MRVPPPPRSAAEELDLRTRELGDALFTAFMAPLLRVMRRVEDWIERHR